MESKKINVTFYLVVIVFLAFIIILVKDFKAQRANDFRQYVTTVSNIVNIINRDNYKIRVLSSQLAAEKKENEDLRNTLAETRNSIDALSKKLAPPAPVVAPASVPTPAPATAAK